MTQLKISKDDVRRLIARFEHVSEQVLSHPKFEDAERELATKNAAACIVALHEALVSSDDESAIHDDLVAKVMLVLEFMAVIDEFCADDSQAVVESKEGESEQ